MRAQAAYARTCNETASPARLMVLLFEAALRHTRQGAADLEQGRATEGLEVLGKAAEIVTELAATLDHRQAPELASTLSDVYLFVLKRLFDAQSRREAAAAREAERVLLPIVDAFQQAVERGGTP